VRALFFLFFLCRDISPAFPLSRRVYSETRLDPAENKHYNKLSPHCNTLPHTATHCHALPQTGTHCHTLQHTVTHCNTLQHTATCCQSLQPTTTHCNTLQHTATHPAESRWREVCALKIAAATHCNTTNNTLQPILQKAEGVRCMPLKSTLPLFRGSNTFSMPVPRCLQHAANHCNTL